MHPADIEALRAAKEVRQRLVAAGANDEELPPEDRIARFVRVNGLWWVMEATTRTCKRLQAVRSGAAPPVIEPWVYLRAVVNGRPARAQRLFLLLNLWETSLRARIDLEYSVSRGGDWYLRPDTYLSVGHVTHLFREQNYLFEKNAAGNTVVRVAEFPSARPFMRELYLGALHNILLDNWDTAFKPRLVHPTVGEVIATQLNSWLRDAFSARREVMHADRVELSFFQQSSKALLPLLQMLEFDISKTLTAIETRDPHAEDSAL